jgi:uncharacterized protein YqjF (DUF2071 family)
LPRPVVFDQWWSELTFIHWPVEPRTVEHLYPAGTRPDVFADGMTYVALVPFLMSGIRLGVSPPVPYFGSFPETNIRLYSVDDAGRHGVLFRSLETSRLAVVPLTRIGLGIPYTWARMRLTRTNETITYDSVRRWPQPGLRSRLTVTVGEVVEPTPLEVWLTARWGAHAVGPRPRTRGRLAVRERCPAQWWTAPRLVLARRSDPIRSPCAGPVTVCPGRR